MKPIGAIIHRIAKSPTLSYLMGPYTETEQNIAKLANARWDERDQPTQTDVDIRVREYRQELDAGRDDPKFLHNLEHEVRQLLRHLKESAEQDGDPGRADIARAALALFEQ